MSPSTASPAPGLRQTMADLHTWVGLLLGWVLYAMFLTGTVAYFKDELSQWMRPELPMQASVPDPALVAQRMADRFAEQIAGASQWSIRVPDARTNSVYAFWRAPRQAIRSPTPLPYLLGGAAGPAAMGSMPSGLMKVNVVA